MPRYFGPCGEIIINIAGAGEGFVADETSGMLLLSSGASGDIITLTPPSGKRVRLESLYSTGDEAIITVTVGAATVVNSLTLTTNAAPTLASGEFTVGNTGSSGGNGGASTNQYLLTKNSNDTIVITKDTGSTGTIIYYSYSYGD